MSADRVLLEAINGLAGRHPLLDAVMVGATRFGPFADALLLVILWFAGRSAGERAASRRLALRGFLAAVLAVAVSGVLSAVHYRPRPFLAHPGSVHLLLPHGDDSSFPSDHAALVFGVAAGARGGRWSGLLYLFAAVVAVSRVYVGHHYPSDVLAGAAVGWGAGWAVARCGRLTEPAFRWVLSSWEATLGALLGEVRRPPR